MKARAIKLFTGAVIAAAFTTATLAADWPKRPIRLVVPYAPGGTVDTVARLLGDKLGTQLGQAIIIENRPGAGGNIGTEAVTRANPDGYTLLMAGNPTHALNPHLYKELTFDPLTDLTPIALLSLAPNLLVVNPSIGVNNVAQLVELARNEPGVVTYSSSGRGTTGHLVGEMLKNKADIEISHIPYRGQADAILGVIRGDVSFAAVTIPGTLAHVNDGKLKAIAITSSERSNLAKDIPTVAESGYAGFEALAWYNLSAPPDVKPEIIKKIVGALEAVMQSPDINARFTTLGLEPRLITGEAYTSFLKSESEKWGTIIKQADVGGQ
ncbi:Bug family tripartite tricarboxylate transporter substrate binding protein [Achromobacter denitrificans]|uniref:Tripartite tricarboxylate transporter substrate binding protein n=1 Tax=Achromobacter denitrificans TaxID=32002 RepID=A0ABZ3FUD2_ACHDE